MRGHIRKRGDGSWAIVLELPRGEDGKRKQRWHSVKGTKRDAERRLSELLHTLDSGQYVDPNRLTVREYLQQWMTNDLQHRVSVSTRERYESVIRLHLTPALGKMRLSSLSPLQVQACYTRLLESGSTRGGGLSAPSVHLVHSVLHQALAQAVRWRLLALNPADAVRLPSGKPAVTNTFSGDDLARLLEEARSHWVRLPVLIALATGMRRGEILGLRWADVDLDECRLSLQQAVVYTKGSVRLSSPKTPGSRRPLDLPSLLVEALRQHKQEQDALRQALGSGYHDHGLILCRGCGEPMAPATVTAAFRWIVRKLGLKGRFHDLRHTHATRLLEQGAHPKIVSERLGHTRVGITLDRYSHVLPHLQKEVVLQFDQDLRETLGEAGLQNVCKKPKRSRPKPPDVPEQN